MNPLAGLAGDARSLDRLKLDAARDPQAAVRQAAGQFEALFMQSLLKSMRDALPKSGLMDGPSQELYTGMLDQQLSQSLAGRPGGLAEMIAKQLSRNIQGGASPGVASAGSMASPTASAGSAAGSGQADLAAALLLRSQPAQAGQAAAGLPDASQLSSQQVDFVRRMWPAAQLAQKATGVPAAFVVGQAALESGWGRQEIKRPDGSSSCNLFGIKAGPGWQGATVDVTTTEFVDGQAVKSVEKFRAYGSYAEAFKDWTNVVGGQARYGQVIRAAQSVEGYAQGMQRAGYATDPAYGAKLEKTINRTLALKRLVV